MRAGIRMRDHVSATFRAVSYQWSMRLWLTSLALAGCPGASCQEHTFVEGHVGLDVAVDPRAYATLEIRGYGQWIPEDPVSTIPQYRGSFPVGGMQFPHHFFIEDDDRVDGLTVFMTAWLSYVPSTPGPARGEPYGKTTVMLVEPGTHSLPSASDIALVLDAFAE